MTDWKALSDERGILLREQSRRIETLEEALQEIMTAIRDEEWNVAPAHAFEIARAALAPEQGK